MAKKFVFVYYNGGTPEGMSKEELSGIMADWGKWFEELGAKLIDGGNPFGPGQSVSRDKTAPVAENEWPSSGYTIVEADDMGSAVEIAKACPMHKHTDGKAIIHVYEAFPM